jgi:hypothetical protein
VNISVAEYRQKVSEHQLQALVLKYLADQAAEHVFAFAVPNAGQRSFRMAARMRAEGMLAGVADVCIALPHGRVAWLEMKASRGRQSLMQKTFEARCRRLGHPYTVAKNFDEATRFLASVGALRNYPSKATKATEGENK